MDILRFVVFDPDKIQDKATLEDPLQFAEGVEHVFVKEFKYYLTEITPAISLEDLLKALDIIPK